MGPTTSEEYESFVKVFQHLKETKKNGIKYLKLNLETTKIVVLNDASFETPGGCKAS